MSVEIFAKGSSIRECSHGSRYYRESTGKLQRVMPGVFLDSEVSLTDEVLMQIISVRCPKIVMNLISALSYHGVTTQIPAYLSVAASKGEYVPKVLACPLRVWRCKPEYLLYHCEQKQGSYGEYWVTSPERTLVDCFRYRNKIGIDIFLEALTLAISKKKVDLTVLAEISRFFHVEKNMLPYVQTATLVP